MFGDSVVALRVPSALAMVGAAACVALLGQRLFGRGVGVTAGIVFAVLPAVTRFGQEARSYAFVVLFAALASLLLLRALDRPGALRWGGYAAAVLAGLSVNLVSGAIVVGHAIAVLVWLRGRWAWRTAIGFGTAVGAALVLALPLVLRGRAQAFRQIGWIDDGAIFGTWQMTVMSTLVAVALVVLAVLAWIRPIGEVVLVTAVAAAPIVAIWLASLLSINYFFSKYLLFTLPAWAVLAAAGVRAVPWRFTAPAVLMLVAALGVPDQVAVRGQLSHSWYTYPQAQVAGTTVAYSQAAQIVADGYLGGDGIVYERGAAPYRMIDIGVAYHLPTGVRPRDVFLDTSAAARNDIYALECTVDCAADEPRLWVVVAGETDRVLDRLPPGQSAALAQHYEQAWTRHVPGLTVALLERV